MTHSPTTRSSLLLRLRDPEDHEAWIDFVTLYEPAVYRLLRRHGLQDVDARDVMQELFLTVSRSIDQWDPAKDRGSFRAWLRRVARNRVINWVKHRERRVVATGGSGLQSMLDMLPASDEPETVEFDHELRRNVPSCGRTSARRSPLCNLGSVLGNRRRRNVADRRRDETWDDGRGGASCQVSGVSSPTSGCDGIGESNMTSQCSVTLLKSALAGNMPAEQEASLHHHLEECEACTTALERMAGGTAWCQEAASLLIRDELDDVAPVRDEWSNIDFTVEHLEPTEEPNVLGRLGGYDVLEIIGRGGMGVVLKGFDRELKRCVAVKVLAPHLAQSSVARKRFTREAQAAGAVVHPNVLAIHQVQPSGRLPFLVTPLIAGESLAQRLKTQGPLELKETLRIGMQAAAGLAAAHEQGLVHRDVKPANILLENGVERAVLTDFGLARAADDASITRWGIIAGTPQYMSPEQAQGEPLDGRSDLFSLGCVLYEMATGVSPFRAESTVATLRRLIDDPPPAMASLNPELPPWFTAIIDRLLEKDRSRRFGSAKEVSELLEGCLAHLQQPTGVPLPVAIPAPAVRQVSTRKNALFKGTATMIAALGIALASMFLMQSTAPPDVAGRWSGEGWGQIVLTQTTPGEYAGTYSSTVAQGPGKIRLKWSRIERRFNGTWREGEDRFGELSVRRADHEIRGAFTTDLKSTTNPATPRLADLRWTPVAPPSTNVDAAGTRPTLGQAASTATIVEAAVDILHRPNGPWVGRLANGVTVELLAIGGTDRWWQPNGLPLAAPPIQVKDHRYQPIEADDTRRTFVARISGVPLPRAGMNFIVEPSSGAAQWIGYENIRKVPTRSYFSGVETLVPTTAPKVTVRWGIGTGEWEDAARAVIDSAGRPFAPGSWGDRLNVARVLGTRDGAQLELPNQPHYEERAIAICDDGHEVVKEFRKSDGRARATFFDVTTKQIKEIKIQRRPYAWIEFRDVPTNWSDLPIHATSAPPNTCNIAAQLTGPWTAQLTTGATVDLVGVGEGDRWWRPDGTPLPEPPCRLASRVKPDNSTQLLRRFFVRVKDLPSQSARIVAEVARGTSTEYPEHVEHNGKPIANGVRVLAFEAQLPGTSQTVTQLRCGVAAGPWRESASPSVNLYPKYIGGGSSSGGRNVSLHAVESKEGVVARVSEDWYDKDDLRSVAITYDDRTVTGRAQIDHPQNERTGTTITVTLPGTTLKAIKRLKVERRPYEWVCFSYVAVQPKPPEDASDPPSPQDQGRTSVLTPTLDESSDQQPHTSATTRFRVTDVTEALDAQLASMRSFDVVVDTSRRVMMESVWNTSPGTPSIRVREKRLLAPEKVITKKERYRQLYKSADDDTPPKRRIEQIDAESRQPMSVIAFDGRVRRSYYPELREGTVTETQGPGYVYLTPDADYRRIFMGQRGDLSLLEMLRHGTARCEHDSDDPDLILVNIPPDQAAMKFPWWAHRVWLEPARGLRIKTVEHHRVIPKFNDDGTPASHWRSGSPSFAFDMTSNGFTSSIPDRGSQSRSEHRFSKHNQAPCRGSCTARPLHQFLSRRASGTVTFQMTCSPMTTRQARKSTGNTSNW